MAAGVRLVERWFAHGEVPPLSTKEHPGFDDGESVHQARRRSTQLAMLGFACAWLRSLRARCARGVTAGSMAWSACLAGPAADSEVIAPAIPI